MNPLHVLLVTDDPGLAKGFSDALAENAEMADVESVRPDEARATGDAPDVVILDDENRQRASAGAAEEMYPDSLVLRLREDAEGGGEAEVEGHFRRRGHGYVRREDLEEIAPVIVALAGLSRAAGKNGAL